MWTFLSGYDYTSLSPSRERKGQWFLSTKLCRVVAFTIATVVLLALFYHHQDAFAEVQEQKQKHPKPKPTGHVTAEHKPTEQEPEVKKPEEKKPGVEFKRPEYLPVAHDAAEERFAYAAFLSKTEPTGKGKEKWDTENYFVAMRTLVWQLRHDPATKASPEIDVVVMVGPSVDEAHRERLRKDGAIVRPVDLVHGEHDDWIVPQTSRWADVMTKLRAWEMEEYSKVLILDSDIILQSSLDDVFSDPGAQLMETKPGKGHKEDEPKLPKEYLLSGIIDYNPNVPHIWPPTDAGRRRGHFNAGFFMLRPDKTMFDYFVGLLDIEGRFNPKFPEQNLLNYAFRWDGAMPFREISPVWNTNFATEDDLKAGTASIHTKWWKPQDAPMMSFALSKRWQMEGFYQALEEK